MKSSIILGQSSPEQIVNPVTGDRMTILQSRQGSYAQIRFDLPPGAKGSPLHFHTQMSETFTVLSGELEMEVGKKGNIRILRAGESLHVPPRMHHSFQNKSDNWVTFTSENRPSGGFEQFIRGMFGLAIDGKVNADGMPTNLFYFALLIKKADTVLVGFPVSLQTLIVNVLVQVGKVLKIERSLAKYWHTHSDDQ